MVVVKSGFKGRGFLSSEDDRNEASRVLKVWHTEKIVLRKQGAHAGQGFGGQKKLLNDLVLSGEESDRKEKMWAGKGPLLLRCFMKDKSENGEIALVRYMDSLPSFGEADDALRCVCQKWATAGAAKEWRDIDEAEGDGDTLVASEWI